MPRQSMLPHTVHLFNFVGEVNDTATYQEAVIRNCCCQGKDGVGTSGSGKKTNDNVTLYIFKRDSLVKSPEGKDLTYIHFDKWVKLADKTGFWTINPNDKDYFILEGHAEHLKVKSFQDLEMGSKRMWHFEVEAR